MYVICILAGGFLSYLAKSSYCFRYPHLSMTLNQQTKCCLHMYVLLPAYEVLTDRHQDMVVSTTKTDVK